MSRFPFLGFSRNKVRGTRGVAASEDSGSGVEASSGSEVLPVLAAVELGVGEDAFRLEPLSLPGEAVAASTWVAEASGVTARVSQYLQQLSKLEPFTGGLPEGQTVAGWFVGTSGTAGAAAFDGGFTVAGSLGTGGSTAAGCCGGTFGTAGAAASEGGFTVAGSFAGTLGTAGVAFDGGAASRPRIAPVLSRAPTVVSSAPGSIIPNILQ